MHILHGRVCNVDLLNKSLTFSIKCLQNDSNGTKHVCIEKGPHNQNERANDVLLLCLWIYIVPTKSQNGCIPDNEQLLTGREVCIQIELALTK
jgi:hypothetical protein